MKTAELIEIQAIATNLKTGEEVPWNRIEKAFNTISTEKNVHRNYKAYKILDYHNKNREEINMIFLEDLLNKIKIAKWRCGIKT